MEVLNLYAGIGGNRKLWTDCDVTAVEYDEETAKVYSEYHPNDNVIVGDAERYLLEHHQDYDFVWTSPPCPTHSGTNNFLNAQGVKRLPDMSLYGQIIYLNHFHKGKFCVENVRSYYRPLIPPKELNRHYFWTNFRIGNESFGKNNFNTLNTMSSSRLSSDEYYNKLSNHYGYDPLSLGISKGKSIKMLRNCVDPEIGQYIFNCAKEIYQKSDTTQTALFTS